MSNTYPTGQVPCPLGFRCDNATKMHQPGSAVLAEHQRIAQRGAAAKPDSESTQAEDARDVSLWMKEFSRIKEGDSAVMPSKIVPAQVKRHILGTNEHVFKVDPVARAARDWIESGTQKRSGEVEFSTNKIPHDAYRYLRTSSLPISRDSFDKTMSKIRAKAEELPRDTDMETAFYDGIDESIDMVETAVPGRHKGDGDYLARDIIGVIREIQAERRDPEDEIEAEYFRGIRRGAQTVRRNMYRMSASKPEA